MSDFNDVVAFHKMFREPPSFPTLLEPTAWDRRVTLILEEFKELAVAHAFHNLVEFADGVVDLAWVVLGTGVEAGLPYDALWREVRRANMDKRGATVDSRGKLLKPDGWIPPNIAGVLLRGY